MTTLSHDSGRSPIAEQAIMRATLVVTAAMTVAGGVAVSPTSAAAQFPPAPPPPAEMRPLQLPPFEEFELGNGLQVVLVPSQKLPLVSIAVTMPGGSAYDPPGKEGLADVMSDVLVKGTTTRSAEQIAATIERVGASLGASADEDFFTFSTAVLKEHVDLAMELMNDVLLNATFPAEEVDLTLTRLKSAIRAQEAQPGFLAARFFGAALYGERHPYGRTATSTSLSAIGRDDLVSFFQTQLRPRGSILVLAGDLTPSEARQLARRYFGPWNGVAAARENIPAARPRATEITLVNRPGSAQSNILVGNLTMRPGDRDYYAAVVANRVLGGGSASRLFQILREEKGWTYGAYSSQNRPAGMGRFQAQAEVRTEVTDSALTEMLHQLRRMRSEMVTDSELVAAKGFLLGSFPLQIQTPQQIASQVRSVKLLRLGDDYLPNYRNRLAAIDAAAIQSVAQRLIKPDSSVIVVVGDGQAVYDKLAAIAPVQIVDKDGNPLTAADLAPPANAVAFDLSQLRAGTDSFTMLVQGNPFGSLTHSYEMGTSTDGRATLTVSTSLALGPMGQQNSTLVLDAETLAPVSYQASGAMQGIQSNTDVQYAGDQVRGNTAFPDPQTRQLKEVTIDRTLEPNTLNSDLFQVVGGAFPLDAGASLTLSTYDPSQDELGSTTLSVEDGGSVTVGAGTFDTWKVTAEGGPAVLEYWISKDSPRHLVQFAIVGQPVTFELATSEWH